MVNYIVRRILLMFPTLLGMTLVVFLVMALSPGGIGGSALNEIGQLDSEQGRELKEYYEKRYGLDAPILVQYVRWLNQISPVGFEVSFDEEGSRQFDRFGFKKPDLGFAYSRKRAVIELFAEALPITLTLNLITTPIAYALAIPLGIYAARHRGSWFDHGSSVLVLALWSMPNIMVAVLLIGYLANRDHLAWFPPSGITSMDAQDMRFLPGPDAAGQFQRGWLADRAWHLVLPMICMVYGSFAFLMKLMRSSVLENTAADFVRTARAKGVDERTVLWGHTVRNSMLPLITVAAGIVPGLLAGSFVIEKIFSIPGMGLLMVDGIFARDRELVLAGALIGGVLSLVFILVADLLYAVADPRVSYD
ncbi:MAG: ABC transporter permease [Planctomycetaceae bacterium]|nr:ABC transporter permease [Planctomycetaceae bacterium]